MRGFIRNAKHWLVGLGAFLWLLLRTGTKPSRIAYPCQQAAMPIAVGWLLAVIAFVGGGLFFRRFTRVSGVVLVFAGTIWLSGTLPDFTNAHGTSITSLPVWQVPDPLSKVFVMDSIPHTIGSLAAGDSTVPNAYLRDPAIDTLLLMFATQGIYLHQTSTHPTGIVHGNDIVIIKGNFQWNGRNTTSADRIKGLIRQVLSHPDGFSGEIIVCDNTQEIGTGINDNDNNSEDPNQSILDVVHTFRAKGYPVYCLDWRTFWDGVTSEYSTGDYTSGYVYESSTKISYPKFRSPSGRCYISLRHGIWDSVSATYKPNRLCIINFPVLKAHGMAGATIAVKNWIGVLTTAYAPQRYGSWDAMHNSYFFNAYALVARVMAVTFPRLSIVDATWTSTEDNTGGAVNNTKVLLASTDPVAVSWYAAKFVLTPIALHPSATNPDLPGSVYRNVLTNWTTFLHDSAGLPCTKDSSRISVYSLTETPLPIQIGTFTANTSHNGVQLEWTTLSEINNYGFEIQKSETTQQHYQTLPNSLIPGHGTTNEPQHYNYIDSTVTPGVWYYRLKQIDLDGTVHYCNGVRVDLLTGVKEKEVPTVFSLSQNYPNPFNPSSTIRYALPHASFVTLTFFNTVGQQVGSLVNEQQQAGYHDVVFRGEGLSSGVYFYRIQAGDFVASKKLLLLK